jgi:hydrogenase maturation protease
MIAVLGLGNVLMGDDGLGPAVIRAFEAEYVVPPGVEVVDLGTPGLDLLPWLADVDVVILVDTVRSDGPPGTLRLYDKADVLRHLPAARVSPHDPGVKEALLALDFAGRAPRELLLVGVVPGETRMSLTLTPAVAAAVPVAVDAVARALARYGAAAARRPRPEGVSSCWPPGNGYTSTAAGSL